MTVHRGYVASTSDLLFVAEAIRRDWERVGVSGQLLARNIDTGEELGFDVDQLVPLASVVKVPIALTVLHLIAQGALDAAQQVTVDPATKSLGPTGVAAFRYPATVAIGDLVLQMLAVSDNAAADVLLDRVGIDRVNDSLRGWECPAIRVRHAMHRMYECAAGAAGGDFALALDLAIQSDETGRHAIETLDPAYANVGSVRALADLLERVWLDRIAEPAATAELRRLMSMQVFTQRLSSDLRADSVRVSAKTGTFLHLRHEIGVVESVRGGDRVVLAALTRSARRATIAPDIDLAIGAAGRSAFEVLRR
jgi:beta-lactamase class A